MFVGPGGWFKKNKLVATVNQIAAAVRLRKKNKNLTKAPVGCPQKRGVRVKIITRSPKKPNSVRRARARITLCTGRSVHAHIPGEGHGLGVFSRVLVRGGNAQDLPGVPHRAVRGVRDLGPIPTRTNGRSKYGTKRLAQ
jgi:small subunit ribosomal protein S12